MIRHLLRCLPGHPRVARRLGVGMAALFSGLAVAAAEPEEDAEGAAAAPPSVCPGDFAHREDDKSLVVHPLEGLGLVLQSSVGGGAAEPVSLCAQMYFRPSGADAVLVAADARAPSLSAVLLPGPSGRSLRLSTAGRPLGGGVRVEGEATLSMPGVWEGAKATATWEGPDCHGKAMLQVPLGGEGSPSGELTYHQSLGPGTGLTAGGSLLARLHPPPHPGSLLPALLPPHPAALYWGTFASWASASRDSMLHAKYGQLPTQEGILEQGSLAAWRRVNKGLELGVDFSHTAVGLGATPMASGMGVGARLTFLGGAGAGGGSGLAPVLTAHASSDLVLGVSLVMPSAAPGSATFMRSTIATVLDHGRKDYKVGLSVEMYY